MNTTDLLKDNILLLLTTTAPTLTSADIACAKILVSRLVREVTQDHVVSEHLVIELEDADAAFVLNNKLLNGLKRYVAMEKAVRATDVSDLIPTGPMRLIGKPLPFMVDSKRNPK